MHRMGQLDTQSTDDTLLSANEADTRSMRRAALTVAVLTAFMIPFVSSSVTIALPSIGKEFDADAIVLAWVRTSYLLTAVMFLIPFGRLGDIFGRKRVFTTGVSLYTAASFLCALAGSSSTLIAFRCLQGLGASMTFGTATAILTSAYPASERGKVLGIRVATVYIGLSMGPFLGGLLTQHLGWRSIFYVNLALGALVVTTIFTRLRAEWADAKGEKFDIPGSLIISIALAATIYGFSNLAVEWGMWLLSAGIIGIAGFVFLQVRASSPLLDVRLFSKNRVFAFSNLAALINYSAVAATAFFLSLYLQTVKGMDPQTAGLVILVQPVTQSTLAVFAGKLSDRVEPRIVASTGMAFTAIALGLLSFLGQGTSTGYIMGSLVVLGFGFALFSAPNTNAIMGSVKKRHYGVASATQGTMIITGMTLSMGIAMLLLDIYVGKVQITSEHFAGFLQSLRMAFSIFTALCVLGIFASLSRGKVR